MQRIDRPEQAPLVLLSQVADDARRRMREFWALERPRRAQTSVPAPSIQANDEQLVEAVSALTGGRCAFCEASDKLLVHRFRPVGNALPLASTSNAHLYYLWLVDAWQNLYPICLGCIPPEPQFPVVASRAPLPGLRQIDTYVKNANGLWPSFPPKEGILLLDPCRDREFEKHLLPKLDGELIGESKKGETTVLVFNLNRSDRRNQRYHAYQMLIERLIRLIASPSVQSDHPDWQQLFDFPAMEFGGTWFLLLRRLARWIGGSSGVRVRSSRTQIRAFFLRMISEPDAEQRLESSLEAIAREDNGLRAGRWTVGSVYSVRAPIASVQITNFKAIEQLELTFAKSVETPEGLSYRRAPSLIILGENATGKSSILEAIALAVATPAARAALDVLWPRLVLDPSQLGLERTRDQRRANVQVALATGQSVSLAIEQGTAVVRSELGNQQVPVFAYGAFRRFLTATKRQAPHKHIRNLFDGSTLSNPEPWLKSLPQDRFNMVIRTLRDLLSIEGDFDIMQRERGTRQLRMVTSITEPNGQVRYSRAPLQSVSSGYRSMLAMLCDIMRGLLDPQVYEGFESFQTAQGVVLIDEIEAHLHPRWKVQVMTSLRAALPGMSFVVTTHDPLCLRGMGEGEVVVLQRVAATDSTRETEMPIVVERIEGLPSVADLRIEQLLTSDFFQLLSSDDAASDRRLAQIGDLIRAKAEGERLSDSDQQILRQFETDIATALPVGSSEVHRIVQEAVAEYLRRRRDASSSTLKRLRDKAKSEILAALEAL
ncbi:AAA family ATPase [Mesorhizobium sp. CO1-1-8]|uniref:AAA family ATPase n=1 Tax=Mesorhizobium sp. CO1-1-8 TaxID=2876631 RepID=UPI001CD1670E|nr:AAA family ATPase [Mesorhizobium sp. CO1-1-8]MBZ9772308.1 AAA family ATPase [Mesorhizobium sp. CO1-1-8]